MCTNSGFESSPVNDEENAFSIQVRTASLGELTSDRVLGCGSLCATATDPIVLSAVDGGAKRGARFGQPRCVKDAYAFDQEGLWHDPEIVEARCALCRHPVVGTERYLRRDVSNSSRYRSGNYTVENSNRN